MHAFAIQIMENPILKLYLLIVVSFVLWFSNGAYSANIDLEINTGATYDSNVSRSFAKQREDDIYFTLAPRVALKLPFNKVYFNSSIRTAIEQHLNQTEANLQELVFYGLGRYSVSDYVSFGLQDDLAISGRLRSADTFTDMTEYREFVDNKVTSGFKYEFYDNTLVASLDYINIIRNYTGTKEDDWITHSGQLQAEYLLGYRTSIKGNIKLVRKKYEIGTDYISIPFIASLKRNLTNKIDASLSFGTENRKYNRANQNHGMGGLDIILDVKGKFTQKTSSKLTLQHIIYDSDILTGYAFTATACDTSLVLNLRDDTQLTLHGLYSRNKYIQFNRDDNVFGGQGSIQYRFIKWGALIFNYGYERRITNVSDNHYIQHIVELYYTALF